MPGIALHGEVERRLPPVGRGNGARGLGAVGLHPARHQPGRRVEGGGTDAGKALRALAGEAAEHRVDEAGVARAAAVRLHQPHREVDGGMVGHVEPENLRRADQQRRLHPRRVAGNAALEAKAEQVAQGAEPAQDRRGECADERAVAIGQRREPRGGVLELDVERTPAAEHAVEDVGGDPARGEPRRFKGGNGARHAAFDIKRRDAASCRRPGINPRDRERVPTGP